MKQITEDYVSFEIAKLLKEKGFGEKFDEFCPYSYSTFLPNSPSFGQTDLRKGSMKHQIYAPTLQMAMKWLREVHHIYIDIFTYKTGKIIQFRWVGYDKGRLFSQEEGQTIYFDTHEEAVEAALKYTLENLI